MALATLNDINVHLPIDKAGPIQDAESVDPLIDAARLIRGRLANTVDVLVMDLWSDPEDTPEIIREIAGKLVAAKYYANLVAEDEADGSEFAQNLYNEAVAELDRIIAGFTVIIGVDGEPIEVDISSDLSFAPNASTSEPFFAIADQWS